MGLTRSHRPRLIDQFHLGIEKITLCLFNYYFLILCYVYCVNRKLLVSKYITKETFSEFDSVRSFAFPLNLLNLKNKIYDFFRSKAELTGPLLSCNRDIEGQSKSQFIGVIVTNLVTWLSFAENSSKPS